MSKLPEKDRIVPFHLAKNAQDKKRLREWVLERISLERYLVFIQENRNGIDDNAASPSYGIF